MTTKSAKDEAVRNADAHLSNAGLPTYSEALAALLRLMNYTGAWDAKAGHPCHEAASVLTKAGDAVPPEAGDE